MEGKPFDPVARAVIWLLILGFLAFVAWVLTSLV